MWKAHNLYMYISDILINIVHLSELAYGFSLLQDIMDIKAVGNVKVEELEK